MTDEETKDAPYNSLQLRWTCKWTQCGCGFTLKSMIWSYSISGRFMMFRVCFSSIINLNLFHSAMIYSCFIVIAAGIFLEGLKLIRHLVDNKFPHKNGARYNFPFEILLNKWIAVTSKNCSPFLICCTLSSSEFRFYFQILGEWNSNIFQMVWGYLCMLMFMSFSLYICVSLIIGIVIGFFLFGARIPSNWGSDKLDTSSHLTSSYCLFSDLAFTDNWTPQQKLASDKCLRIIWHMLNASQEISVILQVPPVYHQMFSCKRNIEENSVILYRVIEESSNKFFFWTVALCWVHSFMEEHLYIEELLISNSHSRQFSISSVSYRIGRTLGRRVPLHSRVSSIQAKIFESFITVWSSLHCLIIHFLVFSSSIFTWIIQN